MVFEIAELSEPTIAKLATAIARAQIQVHDQWADEILAGLPETFEHHVPTTGNIPGEERLKLAREAERAAAKDAQERAEGAAQMAKIQAEHSEKEAQFNAQENLRFKADTARYDADFHAAKASGRPAPAPPLPVQTLADVERAARGAYRI